MLQRKPYVSNLKLIHQGKVRDTYATNRPGLRLMVATDAISTHNVTHKSLVPGKGQILTAQSIFFAREVFPDVPTHIMACGERIYDFLPRHQKYADDLHLRSIVVRELKMIPYELIYRARMAGSLWKKYYSKGLPNPYGHDLPVGLQLMSLFGDLLPTPTEKSETDDEVDAAMVESSYPMAVAFARDVYRRGREYALSCGIDVIDSKCEIGFSGERICLGDEWMNGDCCRFVRMEDIVVGQEPPWADKEIFRQDAVRQWGGKTSGPSLEFSEGVVQAGMQAYRDVFQTLTRGRTLEDFQKTL